MSSREDKGAEGLKRKRGDSGGEHDRVIKEVNVIRKQKDLSNSMKRMAEELFELAQVEDSNPSHLKLTLEVLQAAVKAEKENEVLRAEQRRKKFLFELGDWVAGVISGLKKIKSNIRVKMQEELRAEFIAQGMSNHQASKALDKSSRWDAWKGRDVVEVSTFLEAEIAEVQDFREAGEPAGQAPETPFLDRVERICAEADISFDTARTYIGLYIERNQEAHSGVPILGEYKIGQSTSNGKVATTIDWDLVADDIEERIDAFREMWKTGQIDKEHFDIAEQCVRDWLRIRATTGVSLGKYSVWQQSACATAEIKEYVDRLQNQGKTGQKSAPPSPHTPKKWQKILPHKSA
ncbi:hypothetical protein LA080_015103 [Diaporthe eres]|uniref:Uncharacterized protein n=1 Tax=Diaporthe vaccinii TaxID=105482 RepID=A0ABR4EG93_9PEZI|nr:hypothetical protein LA080_015103 [Diaporthe eres]